MDKVYVCWLTEDSDSWLPPKMQKQLHVYSLRHCRHTKIFFDCSHLRKVRLFLTELVMRYNIWAMLSFKWFCVNSNLFVLSSHFFPTLVFSSTIPFTFVLYWSSEQAAKKMRCFAKSDRKKCLVFLITVGV